MTFEEVVNTIENKRRFGKAYGRDVTIELMKALGNPEKDFEVIHIAGTNGKGSVAAFVSSILQAASFASAEAGTTAFKVGTFVSPHLIDFTERIIVDGIQIPREDAARIGEQLLKVECPLEPTMFDYCLAMAMIYFREQGVRYVVLETGLGGSKDSTAGLLVVPKVCAITTIGLEHTQILGGTLELIAAEKAGIIKAGTSVVVGQMDECALSVIRDRCELLGVPIVQPDVLGPKLKLGLLGEYQRANGAVAAEVVRQLDPEISNAVIEQGLRDARWPGRMDIVSKSPFILVDGAHNPSGVRALYSSLTAAYPGEKFSFVMAVMADKDYLEMAEIIAPAATRIFTTTIEYERALQAADLASALETGLGEFAGETACFEDYHKAIEKATTFPERTIVFGSLYFIGEVLRDYGRG